MPNEHLSRLITPKAFLHLPLSTLVVLFAITILTACVLFFLAWQTTGKQMPLKRRLLLGSFFGTGIFVSRLFLPVTVLILVEAALLITILRVGGKTRTITAIAAALFVEIVLMSGSVLFIEVIFMLAGPRTQSFFANHPVGLAIGGLSEAVLPAAALWALKKYRICLFGMMEKQYHRGLDI